MQDNKEANDAAFEKVRQDKLREVKAGHDGAQRGRERERERRQKRKRD